MSDTWKLVPVEPTEQMIEAGRHVKRMRLLDSVKAIREGRDPEELMGKTAGAEYRAMLDAAPAPPVHSSVQEIMRLVIHYTATCSAMMNVRHEEIESVEKACFAAHQPLKAALTALVDDNHRLRFELDGVRAMRRPEWISVDEKLPGPGVIVFAHFVNWLGKGRTVRAHHAPKHTIEASHWDEDAETDDTDDGSFEPEGWYEDPAVGETLAFISEQSDGKVTHWQPLPPPPTHGIEPEQGGNHG